MARFKVVDNRGRTVGTYGDLGQAQAAARDFDRMQRVIAVRVGMLNDLHLTPAQVDDAERAMPGGFRVPRSGGGALLAESRQAPRMTGGVKRLPGAARESDAHHIHTAKVDAKGHGATGETNGHSHTVLKYKALYANGHTHLLTPEHDKTYSTTGER